MDLRRYSLNYLWYIAFLVSMGLFVYGIYSGEAIGVFRKATSICLSCIGIG